MTFNKDSEHLNRLTMLRESSRVRRMGTNENGKLEIGW